MKKTLLATALVLVCAAAANAAIPVYTGSFATTWSSSDGSLLAAPWSFSGAYADGGKIHANDSAYATLDLAAVLGKTFNGRVGSTTAFVMQAKIYNLAANFGQDLGISLGRVGDMKGIQQGGAAAGNQGITSGDKAWDNSMNRQSWTQDPAANGVNPVTVMVDYGFTTPGRFTSWVLGAVGSSYPGTWRLSNDNREVHPTDNYSILRVGAVPGAAAGGNWGQILVDDIKLQYIVPEPGSMLALGSGLVGLFGMIRRRR